MRRNHHCPKSVAFTSTIWTARENMNIYELLIVCSFSCMPWNTLQVSFPGKPLGRWSRVSTSLSHVQIVFLWGRFSLYAINRSHVILDLANTEYCQHYAHLFSGIFHQFNNKNIKRWTWLMVLKCRFYKR